MTSTYHEAREAETAPQLFDDWFDPIEIEVRDRRSAVPAKPKGSAAGEGRPIYYPRNSLKRAKENRG